MDEHREPVYGRTEPYEGSTENLKEIKELLEHALASSKLSHIVATNMQITLKMLNHIEQLTAVIDDLQYDIEHHC